VDGVGLKKKKKKKTEKMDDVVVGGNLWPQNLVKIMVVDDATRKDSP
jgi:hypothetical protein